MFPCLWMCWRPKENFRKGAEKGGKKVKRRPQLRAEEGGGAPLTHFPRRPPAGPRPAPPARVGVRALRGRTSGAWEARTLPTPSRDPEGSVQGADSPSRGAGAREPSRRLAARDRGAPLRRRGAGAPRPPAEKGTEEGKKL